MVIEKELTLDQSFTPQISLGCSIDERAAFVAQTYTARVTGTLSGVRLNVLSKANLESQTMLHPETVFEIYPLRVAIHRVQAGFPSREILGEARIFEGNAPPDRLITFAKSIPQEAGKQYAIVVNYEGVSSSENGQWWGYWYGATGDQYPDGELFYGPEGETWFASSVKNHDVQFQTYVVPN